MRQVISRRSFLKQAAAGSAGLALASSAVASPLILTPSRTLRRTAAGTLAFRPYYVQRGAGPHIDTRYAYASDEKWDTFHSNIQGSAEQGVWLSDTEGTARFGVNLRWNVEGFGSTYLTADNGGAHYELPPEGQTRELNLNYEFAKSRVYRNRIRMAQHTEIVRSGPWRPSRDLAAYLDLSEGYLEDAEKVQGDEMRRAALAQEALRYALHAGEMMELEKARHDIRLRGFRPDFRIGGDAKAFFLMSPELFMDRFTEVYDYANVTYVPVDRTMGAFEPMEDQEQFDRHDVLVGRLRKAGIPVGGRPLFWFHHCCVPEFIRGLNFDQAKKYVERHTREVVSHYGDEMFAWEIVNEFHDWANEIHATPEQAVELTKLACEVARDTNPNVHRLINNCCPLAEYVQMGEYSGKEKAMYPQRTPWEFTRDLVDAGVDFTLIGQQMYFPYRDLQDIILIVERYKVFEKPLELSEVGVTSGPTDRSVKLGELQIPEEPYVWHRQWDEELQADWLEGVFTMAYSQPWIEAAIWFDLLDWPGYVRNGGLLRSARGEKKPSFERLKSLKESWAKLPPGGENADGCNCH